jgi:8-oxo-dGTP diphosphatase
MSSTPMEPKELTVVAAVIRDDTGRVLLTQRPAGRHMAGLWEFPGGKVASGEDPAEALVRELREELGVEALVEDPITFAVHEEPGLRILLLFYNTRLVAGTPQGREGQDIRWVRPSKLADYPTPPADADLVSRLAAGTTP